ncbi:antibiotic biosynthesis monooxygenase family protein [Streptomyces alkaliphilus]|uniref:Antibiotic biosynthesis monooxygenase n=1 Tax=Streptomyces alkaliphilus TaxID=1472722 RepID=A0A7W3Y205_9ACTN|nr:antibiotic biosynthesis monooxygenase [Streptomyces alkaliphilus]MBB0244825.1 antibiotic biosynthesis monooxygenase [Streptomyces alkaliphilus]MQS06501.1 antibiotic biosynthesis monooxygenase [Streptomyces alkaliphilus]
MSVVKINVIEVPAERREELERRFASRAGLVENSDGFEWFELLRPVEGTDRYLVYTRWRSEADFEAWMNGPMRQAHTGGGEGRPGGGGEEGAGHGGPRPAATGATLWSFEVVQQAAPGGSAEDGEGAAGEG